MGFSRLPDGQLPSLERSRSDWPGRWRLERHDSPHDHGGSRYRHNWKRHVGTSSARQQRLRARPASVCPCRLYFDFSLPLKHHCRLSLCSALHLRLRLGLSLRFGLLLGQLNRYLFRFHLALRLSALVSCCFGLHLGGLLGLKVLDRRRLMGGRRPAD